jgi:starch synthase
VRSFHDQTLDEGQLHVRGVKMDTTHFAGCPQSFVSPLKALSTCLAFVGQGIGDLEGSAEVIHCHTWYAHFSGILAKILYNIPMVITVHSLEPLRPWKRDQLGHGYDLSRWIEKTALETADAIIAVSRSTRDDILRLFDVEPTRVVVIPNGIDTEEYPPIHDPEAIAQFGIDPNRPYVLFVGRMTRQKGLYYLLQAIPHLDPSCKSCCVPATPIPWRCSANWKTWCRNCKATATASSGFPRWCRARPPSPLFARHHFLLPLDLRTVRHHQSGSDGLRHARGGQRGGRHQRSRGGWRNRLSGGPAPVAWNRRTIPSAPAKFEHGLADAINRLAADPNCASGWAKAGRQRVERHYSWRSIAQQTYDLYRRLRPQRAFCAFTIGMQRGSNRAPFLCCNSWAFAWSSSPGAIKSAYA